VAWQGWGSLPVHGLLLVIAAGGWGQLVTPQQTKNNCHVKKWNRVAGDTLRLSPPGEPRTGTLVGTKALVGTSPVRWLVAAVQLIARAG
jgi:hypothetical protein